MAQTYAAQDQEQQPVNEGLQGQPIHTSWENISFCFKLHLKIKACPNQKRNPIFQLSSIGPLCNISLFQKLFPVMAVPYYHNWGHLFQSLCRSDAWVILVRLCSFFDNSSRTVYTALIDSLSQCWLPGIRGSFTSCDIKLP